MSENKLTFESENIVVDYLSFKFQHLDNFTQKEITNYLFKLGFNSYQKDRDNSKSRQEITFDRRNLYEVVFILKINYQEGTHIEFLGASANKIFDLINQERLQW